MITEIECLKCLRLDIRIVTTLTEEFELEVVDLGATTLNREDLEKGAEPDTGFYIQNAPQLDGLDPEIPVDLPPDRVNEAGQSIAFPQLLVS